MGRTTRTPNGPKKCAHGQQRKRSGPIMVLLSKRESRPRRKPVISICLKQLLVGRQREIACASHPTARSCDADEQLRAFTNLHASFCCNRSLCSFFLDALRQLFAAITQLYSRRRE